MKRLWYCIVSVVTNDAQIHNACSTADNVHGDPKVTKDWAKIPNPLELIDQGEGGDTQTHKDVAESETDDEDVAHAMEATVHQDGQNHQTVSKHGADNNQDSENGDENVNGSTYEIMS